MGLLQTGRVWKALQNQQKLGIALWVSYKAQVFAQPRGSSGAPGLSGLQLQLNLMPGLCQTATLLP